VPGLAPGARRSNILWAPSALFAGNWKCVMPTLFQVIPKAATGFENKIVVCCLAHRMALAFRSVIERVKARQEFNRVLAF